ncbi:Copia protein [Vitis vinifera]|uniref:Copia protein n=1 Tax=Vitis vinifera TaxID=29760 RepID=A0A438FTD9_VITVI|nr:Copia protein [Vitis vinifera]
MATKSFTFSSVISGSPMITSKKLIGSENYLSWFASVELWFMGQGYEDHLVTQEADIPEISRPSADQILGSSSVPSLDDVFARLLRISSTQTLPSDNTSDSSVYMGSLPALPTWPSHLILSRLSLPVPSHLRTGNASASLTHTSSLGPWILDSGTSDYIFGNKDLLSSITTTSALPTVTLANGSQTMAKGLEYGKDDWHRTRLGHPSLSNSRKWSLVFHLCRSLRVSPVSLGNILVSRSQSVLNNRAKSPFQLVHTDVWGSCRTTSTLGFQYFVTFIDDYSRCTWLFLMKNRAEYSLFFRNLCEIQTQFNISIRVLRSNNAREYFSTPFTSFMSQHGSFISLLVLILLNKMGTNFLPEPQNASSWIFQTSKGLSLLFFETHRYFVSADVTFFEYSPFFSTSESLPVSESYPFPLSPHLMQCVLAHFRFIIAVIVSLFLLLWPRYLLTHFLSLRLLLSRLCLLLLTYPLLFGKSTPEALSHPGWRQAMVGPDGQVDRLKARLVAKGYTQVYGSDYGDTFSLVAKIASVRLLLSMAAMRSWSLYQLDIKNAFLHGILLRKFIWSNHCFVAQGESGLVCRSLACSTIQQTIPFSIIITLRGSTKDLGKLKYFLGIEIAHSSSGVVLSKRSKLNYLTITRPDISFPVSVVSQFLQSPSDSHWDAVIRILRYIKSTPGQGVLYENRGHTHVVGYTDADWADSPTDRRSTFGYCVFIGGNLIPWKSKKQDVVVRSSVKAEYRAMTLATCELIWLKHLLWELRFGKDEQMKLIYDNQAALHIASNPVFHERTKHIEVDCHFIREKIASGCVATSFVNSNDQLADIFIKSLRGKKILPSVFQKEGVSWWWLVLARKLRSLKVMPA